MAAVRAIRDFLESPAVRAAILGSALFLIAFSASIAVWNVSPMIAALFGLVPGIAVVLREHARAGADER